MPWGQFRTTVVIELYRVRCPTCGLKIEKVEQLSSKRLAPNASKRLGKGLRKCFGAGLATKFGVAESTVRAIDLRYLERWREQRRKPAWRHMGVDEIFLGKTTEIRHSGE